METFFSYGGNSLRRSSSTSRKSSSGQNGYRDIPIQRSSIQESEQEYSYSENNGTSQLRRSSSTRMTSSNSYSNGYSNNKTNNYSNGYSNKATTNGGLSLDGMRKPKIDSWDSMGILGLTSKMWNDTIKTQETFMQSTGQFLREETTSYIM